MKQGFTKSILILMVSLIAAVQTFAQISGKITDASGEPLPGVTIIVQGTTLGATTDLNGAYKLAAKEGVLHVTYTGFATQDVPINGRSIIDLTMVEESTSLNDVVVIGYGTQKKSVVTGAIASIQSNDLKNAPIVRLEDALKGRASGVSVATSSGQPGASSTVIIRGITSINNSVPLYVVDGVPINENGIDFLNQSDIESIEILKDAASAAIYGTKAASGVIIVTTKKGKAGGLRVNYNTFFGTQAAAHKLNLLNASDYATLRNEAAAAANNPIPFPNIASLGQGTDWQSTIFNDNALLQNHDLSFSSGNDKSTYYASFGYFKQEGIVATDISNYNRFTARLNSDHQVKRWLRFGQTFSYAHIKSKGSFDPNGSYGGPLSSAINLDPISTVIVTDPDVLALDPNYANNASRLLRDENGNVYGLPAAGFQEMSNPLAYIQTQLGNYGWSDAATGNAYLEIEPIKNLKLRSTIGAKLSFWGNESFSPIFFLSPTLNTTNTNYNRVLNRGLDWIWTNTAAYTFDVRQHNFSILLGTEGQDRSARSIGGGFSNLPVNNFESASLNYALATEDRIAYGYENQPYRLSSIFSRLNYNYAGKYLLTAIVRRDGSSHFGSNNIYGTFPSVSIGWLPHMERFWPENNVVNTLKLRAGYGVNGNDNLAPFQYVSTIGGIGAYVFGQDQIITGYGPSAPANPDLQWEQTSQIDLGFDAIVFKDFNLTFDVFKKKTTGMLMQTKQPYYTGASADPWGNVATMENKGLEVDLGYRKQISQVNLSVKTNVSYVKNEITDMGATDFLVNATFQSSAYEISRKMVGMPVNAFFGFVTDGVFQNQADISRHNNDDGFPLQPDAVPGDFRFVDVNDDGVINSLDRTYLGDPTPHWSYGLSVGAIWKAFDLNIFGQGVAGNKIFQGLRRLDIPSANYTDKALGRWTGEGTSTDFARLVEGDPNGNFSRPSNYYLENGAYFRIKTINLGFTLPKRLLQRADVENLRIYVSGNNLVTITKYTGFDPEIGGSAGTYGIDRGVYPQARSLMAGLNLTF
jgi:TonB-linked SusC/RagA family outer membrane protein